MKLLELNLIVAWAGLLLGFVSGLILGCFFHREDWLGGYGSLRRRLYRLAHISFFGLGATNLLFYLTLVGRVDCGPGVRWASAAFLGGALTMPVCCVILAHWPRGRLLFSLPVVLLIAGGVLTFLEVIQP